MQPVVLIVDDDPDTLDTTSLLLRTEGFAVVSADNGREAVEMAYLHRPAAILMDLGMYVLGGLDAVKALRADTEFAETQIFALTGRGDEQTRAKALQAGFNAYYMKPVDFPTLTAALRSAIGP